MIVARVAAAVLSTSYARGTGRPHMAQWLPSWEGRPLLRPPHAAYWTSASSRTAGTAPTARSPKRSPRASRSSISRNGPSVATSSA